MWYYFTAEIEIDLEAEFFQAKNGQKCMKTMAKGILLNSLAEFLCVRGRFH